MSTRGRESISIQNLSEFDSKQMSSSSNLEVISAQSQPAQAHPDPWEPQFQINGKSVTFADSVIDRKSVV